ncbi:MAG TPA: amidohydrolase family protein [Bryobacteraceae bacterium]|nr:amidohydrolase family protein [Bryobacteraceae bacterium]
MLTSQTQADQPSLPIIDTHIHMFDPTRPEGVPWPPKTDRILYKPALPERYRSLTSKLGVVGAVVVEASPWLEDNQWVLDVAKDNPIIVGFVGDLEPDKPDFRRQFDRFHRNPLFRGIRYGNLWGRDLGGSLNNPVFVEGLKFVADAGLEMDTANPDPKLIYAVVQLTDKIPSLRVVVDHLPGLKVPADKAARQKYEADLRELGKRPQVYVKISQVPQRVSGVVSFELSHYRPLLDHLWEVFGADRLLYGSDWPNSDPSGRYDQILSLVRSYFAEKGTDASEKYFWKNSIAAYRWVKRDHGQPQLPA